MMTGFVFLQPHFEESVGGASQLAAPKLAFDVTESSAVGFKITAQNVPLFNTVENCQT